MGLSERQLMDESHVCLLPCKVPKSKASPLALTNIYDLHAELITYCNKWFSCLFKSPS